MKMKFLAILVLLLLLIIPGCGDDSGYTVNTNATPTTQTPAPIGASTVQGTVYGSNGQPVGTGITVRLTPNIASVTASENYGEQQTTTTDSQGGFSFTVHYPGAYLLDALDGTQLLGSQLFNITGAGQVINILLGQATGRLTVTIVPANAEASVTITPGGDLTTSAATVTGSQTGEYIFYLPAGLYTVNAAATGYKELAPQSVTIAEGGEETLTFDFTAGGEVPVVAGGIDPYACINTGEVPVKYYVEDFIGTGTIEFILRSTGEVVKTVSVDESNLNTFTIPGGNTYYYLAFTIDTTGMPAGFYDAKLTHNPPVIDGSSTTAEIEFYVSDTIQGAINAGRNLNYWNTPQEIVTPWGSEFHNWIKVYIPAGNYQYGVSPNFPDATIERIQNEIYFQGAGPGNTVIDFNGEYNYFRINYGVIEGFTIKNSANCAIYCESGDNYIFNNRIESNNSGISDSGCDGRFFNNIITKNTYRGIYIDYINNITRIENNVITANGGGIFVYTIYGNCFIKGNNIYENTTGSGYPGGGIAIYNYQGYSCEIKGNVISGNSTTDTDGGGIYFYNNYGSGPVNIQNNEITQNTVPDASYYGGGIYYEGSTDSAGITGNNIYGNTSVADTGNQLYVLSPAAPLLNADNNWWGAGVTIDDTEVYQVTTSVDIGTPAVTQFPVPDVPSI